jgi:hypothetical protein
MDDKNLFSTFFYFIVSGFVQFINFEILSSPHFAALTAIGSIITWKQDMWTILPF